MNNSSDTSTEQLDNHVGVLVLVTGTLKDGQSQYAYASISLVKYEAFKKAEAAGNYNLAEYGKILAHGEGLEPPEEVKQRMQDEYGANHYFEEDMETLMRKIRNEMEKHTPSS